MTELVTKTDLNLAIDKVNLNLNLSIENVKSSLTVRLGSMIAAGIIALVILRLVH